MTKTEQEIILKTYEGIKKIREADRGHNEVTFITFQLSINLLDWFYSVEDRDVYVKTFLNNCSLMVMGTNRECIVDAILELSDIWQEQLA